jgi:hypothetical protein
MLAGWRTVVTLPGMHAAEVNSMIIWALMVRPQFEEMPETVTSTAECLFGAARRWPAGPGGWPGRGIPRAAVRCPCGAAGAAGPVSASLCLVPSVLVALVSSCRG